MGVTKNQYIGGIVYKKGGFGSFEDLWVGLAKKRGLVFFRGVGVDTTMHTMMEEIKAMAQEIQKMSIL